MNIPTSLRFKLLRGSVFLIFIVTLLLIFGCNNPHPTDTKEGEVGPYMIIRMDGCEYFHRKIGYSRELSHKGNCDNPIHIYSSEEGGEPKS